MNNVVFLTYWLYISLLAFFDNVLTHYQFFLTIKKNAYVSKLELNPIGRFLMKPKPSPWSFIKLGLFQEITLFILSRYFFYNNEFFHGGVIGMFMVIQVYHLSNLKTYKLNWDNKSYWFRARSVKR